ncbi:3'-5' exoribonuclease [Amycolatopsis cynarae]|uniref:3'-5' exoribonuclease n=1 Tax=Amycolatopsis cynarae TaxID=2995223 RepID=A0ABY7B8C0_9PSEU|nr:3'-5' exoribonuclease [Amycolatopsis sp. HUAS 11-8]WAL67111.1 3'-5' exoribonuclease [Amycolatopsis sp. HUAS 11-8]
MSTTAVHRDAVPHLPLTEPTEVNRRIRIAINDDHQWLGIPGRRAKIDFTIDTTDPRVKPKWVIANEVREFLLAQGTPELWAYYGAYDHVALMQLWGSMVKRPSGVPMWTHDLKQLHEQAGHPKLPGQGNDTHDALADARWNRLAYANCEAALHFEQERPQ